MILGWKPRVTALEAAVTDMRVTLGRIDERTAMLATKEGRGERPFGRDGRACH